MSTSSTAPTSARSIQGTPHYCALHHHAHGEIAGRCCQDDLVPTGPHAACGGRDA
jgi:hypothetical protein